jgi:hypothetical protein
MFFIAFSRPAKAYSYGEAVSTNGGAAAVGKACIADNQMEEEGNWLGRKDSNLHRPH